MASIWVYSILIVSLVGCSLGTNFQESNVTTIPTIVTPNTQQNKTIADLFNEQTETIKKIVASQKPQIQPPSDYPTVTKQEADITEYAQQKSEETKKQLEQKRERERESIEELKRKCALYNRLVKEAEKIKQDAALKKLQTTTVRSTTVLPTVQAFGPPIRPIFLRNGQNFNNKIEQTTRGPIHSGNMFIFGESFGFNADNKKKENASSGDLDSTVVPTTEKTVVPTTKNTFEKSTATTTERSTTITPKLVSSTVANAPHTFPLNYLKYEPVVFQKTLVSNGQNYYYWYRAVPRNQGIENIDITTSANNNYYSTTPKAFVPSTVSTTRSTTTSTTEKMPTFEIIYQTKQKHDKEVKKQHIKSDLRNSDTHKPSQVNADELNKDPNNKYKSQLKFILPLAISSYSDVEQTYPWQVDPYAYYPRHLQPAIMNIQVPYVPSFHMIRTLSVPDDDREDDSNQHKEVQDIR